MRPLVYKYSAYYVLDSASYSNPSVGSYPMSFLISEYFVKVNISIESDCFLNIQLFQIQAQHEIERQDLKLLFSLCKRNWNTSFLTFLFRVTLGLPSPHLSVLYKVVFYNICLPKSKLNAKFIRLFGQLYINLKNPIV